MPNYDVRCDGCGVFDVLFVSSDEMSDSWSMVCTDCGANKVKRVFVKAPHYGMAGGESSKNRTDAMRRDFDQRFISSGEMDQVRHKHGDEFDKSLLHGATKRLRNGKTTTDHWKKD